MRLAVAILMGLLLAAAMGWQEQGPRVGGGGGGGVRFEAVDVFVDSGATPLAAWQVQIKALGEPGAAKLVGIEGGDGVYKDPPYYDPAALHESQVQDCVVLAAFSTGAELPSGRTRVARLHLQVSAAGTEYQIKLMTAGAADGTKIEAKATTAGAER